MRQDFAANLLITYLPTSIRVEFVIGCVCVKLYLCKLRLAWLFCFCLRRFGRFAVWDTHLKSVTLYVIITQRNSMFPINFSSKKGGFQGTSGEDWTKIVAHKHWLLRELYGRNSIVPHISTFPTIFVQKVRSKGALSSFLTGERAKPSLFVQHKLTQTIRARTEKSDQ